MVRKKVVFVDDNEMILRWAVRAFRDTCDVQAMECPGQVFSAVKKGLTPIADPDLIVSDYDMPGMDGVEFLGKAREMFPRAKLVLFTARNDVRCDFATVICDKDFDVLSQIMKG